jgi:hypothetical protein
MKILVTGSREWCDEALVRRHLARYPKETVLVHGDAHGADRIAAKIAKSLGFIVRPYPAAWETLGRAAGGVRNQEMLDKEHLDREPIDVALAFHDDQGLGKGTRDMVARLVKAKIQTTHVSHANPDGKILFPLDGSPV